MANQPEIIKRLLRGERIAKVGNWSRRLGEDAMYWSPELCRIYGIDPGTFEPSMQRLDDTFFKDDLELVEKGELRVLQKWRLDPNVVDRIRVRIVRPDGEIRYCDISTVVEVDADGDPVELAGTVQDITELVEAEQRLLRSQKMEVMGQLVGGTAHDFNNLLAIILGNLELLEDEGLTAEQAGFVSGAISATLKGADLTRSLLSFARKAVLNPQRINLNDRASEMREFLARLLPETIQLKIKQVSDCWSTHADKSSFENSVLNLVINARDAMPNGGTITIETSNVVLTEHQSDAKQDDLAPGPYVVFALTDTGTGIDEATLDQVFTPFFSTKPSSQGSGLGLSMVQGFIKQSGGTLRIYTEVGTGTTIKLYFPASALDASMEVSESMSAPKFAGEGAVLLAEDNDLVRRVLELRLVEMGFSCTSANSGDHAAEIFDDLGPFNFLVTDIVMPGKLQGPDLARTLRKKQPDLKVIFITGYPNEADIHGNGLKSSDIKLMKPVSKNELSKAVRQMMDT